MTKRLASVQLFCQLSAIFLSLLSALLIAKGSFSMTPPMLAEMASTRFDFSEPILIELSNQAAAARAGTFLLVLGVAFQITALLVHVGRPTRRVVPAVAALAVSLITYCLVSGWAERAGEQYARDAKIILARELK